MSKNLYQITQGVINNGYFFFAAKIVNLKQILLNRLLKRFNFGLRLVGNHAGVHFGVHQLNC